MFARNLRRVSEEKLCAVQTLLYFRVNQPMMQLIMSIHLEKYPEERFSSSSQTELCSPSYYEQSFMAQEEVEPHAK